MCNVKKSEKENSSHWSGFTPKCEMFFLGSWHITWQNFMENWLNSFCIILLKTRNNLCGDGNTGLQSHLRFYETAQIYFELQYVNNCMPTCSQWLICRHMKGIMFTSNPFYAWFTRSHVTFLYKYEKTWDTSDVNNKVAPLWPELFAYT